MSDGFACCAPGAFGAQHALGGAAAEHEQYLLNLQFQRHHAQQARLQEQLAQQQAQLDQLKAMQHQQQRFVEDRYQPGMAPPGMEERTRTAAP